MGGNSREEDDLPPSYLDEPSDSVSLRTQHDRYTDDVPQLDPPAYNDIPGASYAQDLHERTTPNSDFADMQIISQRNGVSQQMNTRFDTDPSYVEGIVKAWAMIPPKPKIQVKGTHTETKSDGKKDEKTTVTDFDIKLDLGQYLRNEGILHGVPWRELVTAENYERTYRGTITKKRAPGSKQDIEIGGPKPDLREWCHRYCASHSNIKNFRFDRVVTGLDKKYLEEQLTALVRSTNYRGHVDISFPVEERGVEVYSAHWVNRWRINGFICFLFYITFLWIFTWPFLFFATKRFAVVRAEWPWARRFDDGTVFYSSISERSWFEHWKFGIEKAVLAKRQGPLTEEDLQMLARPRETIRSGNQHLDTAVSWLIAGAAGVSEAQRVLGWGRDS